MSKYNTQAFDIYFYNFSTFETGNSIFYIMVPDHIHARPRGGNGLTALQ